MSKLTRVSAIFVMVAMAVALMLCVGCDSSKDTGINTDDENIIRWEISDEAKVLRERLMSVREDSFDKEAYYETIKEVYNTRTVQSIPTTEVNNNMGHYVFMRNDVYTLDNGDNYDCIVLYIHGGAWTYEIDTLHVKFCDKLVDLLNAKVYMPMYPLAPEATYYESYRMVSELYNELCEQNKPIYVMGDSAGGNISLGLMHLIKRFGKVMPEKLVLFAPCADMTFTNEDMKEIEPNDPVLTVDFCLFCAEMWAYERDLDDPLLSAVYSDTTGFPDTLLFAGTHDILYPDNVKLYEKMKEDGNDITLIVGEGLWHVFPLSNIPENQKTLDLIKEFCGK